MHSAQHSFWEVHGQISVLVIIFLAVILIISASLFSRVSQFLRFGANSTLKEQAVALAEAGVDRALFELNRTAGAYPGDTSPIALTQDGSFQATITPKALNLKTITSTGYIGDTTSPKAKRTIKVDAFIDSQIISFNYAVQTGTGGVTMANSSTINGNVYSNGNITGSGSSTIDGSAFAVGTISSPDPIVTGSKNPGASPQPLPTVDYDYWKKAACNNDPNYPNSCQTTTVCSPTCTISANTTIGTTKYQGNLAITNNAFVTLNGPIWVTGNFSMSQGDTTLKLNDNFGSNSTTVIVDGTADLSQGGAFVPTNASPNKGYILLATTSTADPAISLSQSGATALFYALDGGADLFQSAHVVSLAAKKLTLRNSASLDYDTGLASTLFTSGPGASWQLKKGTYKYVSSP